MKKILLIEDEKNIAEIVIMYLKKEGYEALYAQTGSDGLNMMSHSPDLIILDLTLPDMDGEDIAVRVRENSDIPIIMLTAKSYEKDILKGFKSGADDYVIKPFSPRELMARVKSHLRRSGNRNAATSFNNGCLLIDKQMASLNGTVLPLTQTEFKILTALSEHPGRVLSREQLLSIALGYDFEGSDRAVDAHVKNLRRKLGD
ncbi:MAG: response regulator transcription factor, partial [Nitrospirae bacterium]|nr:response regulator transcription factor [Nitrospirota bacterium]